MKKLNKSLVVIKKNLLEKLNETFPFENYPQVIILTDENVANFWLDKLLDNLKHSNIHTYVIPAGEEEKKIERVQDIWDFLLENRINRHDLLINFGGGVITDLGGFVASTFFRGISFLNIPTTLLSQSDASIGGKTGINFAGIKNSIGTFNPAEKVLIDPVFLSTLPKREFTSGLGEVVKYALIYDKTFFDYLEEIEEINDSEVLKKIIENSAKIKQEIVAKDFLESGLRKILNFGHTVGHAIESLSYETEKPLLHGEAVGLGMLIESEISREIGLLDSNSLEKIKKFLVGTSHGLSLQITKIPAKISVEKIMEKMISDKKNFANEIRWILLSDIGKAEIDQVVDEKIVLKVLAKFY